MSSRPSVQNVSSSVPVLGEQFQNLDLIGPKRENTTQAAQPPHAKRSKKMDLFKAIQNNDLESVKQALANGADVNAHQEGSYTALMEAAWEGHTEIVQLLIKARADVNLKNQGGGYTALMIAAENGHTEIVQLLIEAGADVNVQTQDEERWTALEKAVYNVHIESVKLLIEAGARIQQLDVDSILHCVEQDWEDLKERDTLHNDEEERIVQDFPKIKTLLEERLEEQKELLRSAGRKVIKKHGLLPGELGNRISEYIASEYH